MTSPLAAALMQMPQQNIPQQPFAPIGSPTMAPTDVIGAYKNAQDAAMQSYAAQVARQNAMFGGLAGLGGAGITALPKLLSMGKSAAAGAPAAQNIMSMAGNDALSLAPDAGTVLADAGASAIPYAGIGSVADALAPAATGAFSAGAPIAADLAASTAPAVADAAATAPDWLTALLAAVPFLAA